MDILSFIFRKNKEEKEDGKFIVVDTKTMFKVDFKDEAYKNCFTFSTLRECLSFLDNDVAKSRRKDYLIYQKTNIV